MKENNTTILTIMIPVYNGAEYLAHLLSLFDVFFTTNAALLHSIEIRVINNVSTDTTLHVAQSFSHKLKNLIIHDEKIHMKSAEENFFRSFVYCKGVYTWVLGVDDIPIFENLKRILSILILNNPDFLVFNTAIVNQKMEFITTNVFDMDEDWVEKPIVDIARETGLWFVLAGTSNQILRTQLIQNYDLQSLINITSPIYSHVIAYLEIFHKKITYMINLPIVFYKVTYRDILHWKNAAEKMQVFDEFFWTLGFIKQIKYLESKGIVDNRFFFYLMDRNEFIIFRPISVVLSKIISQIETMSKNMRISGKYLRNQMSSENFFEITNFLLERDPFCRELVWAIIKFYEAVVKNTQVQKNYENVIKLQTTYQSEFLFFPFLIGKQNCYEIYQMHEKFYAINENHRQLLSKIMKAVVKKDLDLIFFESSTIEELRQKIQQSIHIKQDGSVNDPYIKLVNTMNTTHTQMYESLEANFLQLKSEANHMAEILRSNSWNITGPFRVIMKYCRKLWKRVC